MPWAQFQKAQDATWDDYERVSEAMDVENNPPEGLIVHAAGEQDGKWRIVAVWESEAAWHRFRDERLMPRGDSGARRGSPGRRAAARGAIRGQALPGPVTVAGTGRRSARRSRYRPAEPQGGVARNYGGSRALDLRRCARPARPSRCPSTRPPRGRSTRCALSPRQRCLDRTDQRRPPGPRRQ